MVTLSSRLAESLQPGTPALFVLAHDANPAVVRAALEGHHGTIIQTTLSAEAEESVELALRRRGSSLSIVVCHDKSSCRNGRTFLLPAARSYSTSRLKSREVMF